MCTTYNTVVQIHGLNYENDDSKDAIYEDD